jgi:SH3-like domain-containing protein
MKRLLLIVLFWAGIVTAAQAFEVAAVRSTQTLLATNNRGSYTRMEPTRTKVAAGSRVLVLFHQDGYAGVMLAWAEGASGAPITPAGGGAAVCGYLPDKSLQDLHQPATSIATLQDKDASVNLRAGPGADHPIVKTLQVMRDKGAVNAVFVLRDGEWSQVMAADGTRGYVHESRLRRFVLDIGDDADKRRLVQTVLAGRPDKNDKEAHAARVEAYCGGDLYWIDCKTHQWHHRLQVDHLSYVCGRYRGWAAVLTEARDAGGHWVYFGGVPTRVLHAENGRWVQKGNYYDGTLAPDVPEVPDDVVSAFRIMRMHGPMK